MAKKDQVLVATPAVVQELQQIRASLKEIEFYLKKRDRQS